MVTNLTEEAKAIWAKAIMAKDPSEKLRLLQLFFSKMPHHKGTEKLEVSIKRQIASLKEEIAESRKKKAVRKDIWIIKKEGIIAVVVDFDFSDSFYKLTGIKASKYEVFSRPVVAPIKANDVTFQAYYAPIGAGNFRNFMKLIKQADVLLIADKRASELIENEGIVLVPNKRRLVEIDRMPSGGIRIIGKSKNINEEELRKFLKGYGLENCVIKISEDAMLDDVEDYIFGRMQKVYVYPSYEREKDVESVLKALGLIRVYTLDSSGNVEGPPLLINENSTPRDVAEKIGIKNIKFAYLIRDSSRLKVGPNFVIKDGDKIRIIS
jgi:ribosome-interacting GTPase 1